MHQEFLKPIQPHLVRLNTKGAAVLRLVGEALPANGCVIGMSLTFHDIDEMFVNVGAPIFVQPGPIEEQHKGWPPTGLTAEEASKLADAMLAVLISRDLGQAIDDIFRTLHQDWRPRSIRLLLLPDALVISEREPDVFAEENDSKFSLEPGHIGTRAPLCTIALPEPLSQHDRLRQQQQVGKDIDTYLSFQGGLGAVLADEYRLQLVASNADELSEPTR